MYICPCIEALPYNIKGGLYADDMSGIKACLYVKCTDTRTRLCAMNSPL